MNNNIFNLEKVVNIKHPEILYLVIHQNHTKTVIPDFLIREDIEVIQTNTKGLSKSRNIGLNNCKTEYALITDDDVEFIENGVLEILDIIKSNKLDFATFKIKTPINQPEFRDYKNEEYSFSNGRIQVASIELLVNVRRVISERIQFDERFGLGTILNQGEEEILISDFLEFNLEGRYYPTYIVIHSYESTGTRKIRESKRYFIKGAFSKRINSKVTIPKNISIFRKIKNYFFYHLGRCYILLTK